MIRPDLSESARLHEEKYKAARMAGLPGWGGAERVAQLPGTIKDRFFRFRDIPRSGRLLELGCGAGNLSLALTSQGYEVSGIDFSETAIAWAKDNARDARAKIDFQVGDVTDLSRFGSAFFDIVYDGNCLHCILGENRQKTLREVFRVLKPGGIFFVSSMLSPDYDPGFPENFDSKTRIRTEGGIAYRFIPTARGLEEELSKAGFTILMKVERQESPFGHVNIHARKT